MANNSGETKRIAKNTGLLYVRMLVSMIVSLYTSRIVLRVLGVEDYGIYNAVGGIVGMMAFLNAALNTATQRYLSYEMGKNNQDGLNKVFSMSFWAFLLISVVGLVLAETVGLWFVTNKMVIPETRMSAALWVYQFSIVSFIINLITVPYNATIIAHERMSIYAYLSISDVILKLLLVYLLSTIDADKLWLYALMMMVVQVLVSTAYRIICRRLFQECKISFQWDKKLFKGLFSFSGWMLAGTITNLFSTQGINILINLFFGPLMNAARGVAMQVYSAVNVFSVNFMTAVRPPIMKSYAQGAHDYMYKLTFSASRLGFYILLALEVPLIIYTEDVLYLWLGQVPAHSVLLCRLALFDLLITSAYNPIAYINQAGGDIKWYQLMISCSFALIFILTWVAYKLGLPVEMCFIIAIAIDILGLFARLWIMRAQMRFPVRSYLKQVMLPIVAVFALSYVSALGYRHFVEPQGIIVLLLSLAFCVAVTLTVVWLIGITRSERRLALDYVGKFLNKLRR